MRFVIVGAGGIGGALGARLMETGREVLLVARGANAEAMRTDGLRLAIPERVITVHPPVVESVADLQLRLDDVLILSVKSQDAAPLYADLAARPIVGGPGLGTAGETLPIYCAQNGTGNESAALRYFANVHGIEVTLQATHLQPGRVTATSSPYTGIFEIGRFPSGHDDLDEQVARHLSESGILTTVRDDVMAWKRVKLLRNLRNALEAMCGPEPDERPAVGQLRSGMIAEGKAVFAAGGLSLISDEEFAAEIGQVKSLPVGGEGRAGGSTWQSVTRGLGSVETDFLNGEIALLGRLYGVPTPLNVRVQTRMAQFIRAGEPAGSVDPETLLV
jgi:2-dehydropantoate 2-reductase